MTVFLRCTQLCGFLWCLLLILFPFLITAKDDCQPANWTSASVAAFRIAPAVPTTTFANDFGDVISTGNAKPGEVNCRFSGHTNADANYYSCTLLAKKYSISVEKFFMLNPSLKLDCSNIQPNTWYCTAGCK